jgi:hypothetical protein
MMHRVCRRSRFPGVALFVCAIAWPAEARAEWTDVLYFDGGLSVIGVGHEHIFARHLSGEIEAVLYSPWFLDPNVLGGGVQARSYVCFPDAAPEGIYLSPFVRGELLHANLHGEDGLGFGWSSGLSAGYARYVGGRVLLRGGAGAQFIAYDIPLETTRVTQRTFYPTIDLGFGFPW